VSETSNRLLFRVTQFRKAGNSQSNNRRIIFLS